MSSMPRRKTINSNPGGQVLQGSQKIMFSFLFSSCVSDDNICGNLILKIGLSNLERIAPPAFEACFELSDFSAASL